MKKYLSFFVAALILSFAACNNVDEPNEGDNPLVEGSKENPYTVTEAISKQGGGVDKWVKAYIVGAVKGLTIASDSVELGAPFSAVTNILIAESETETDISKMMPVQLSAGVIRETLNLAAHPTNLGKEVLLKGTLTSYFSKPGIKTLTDIVFEGYVPPVTSIDICTDSVGVTSYSNDFEDAIVNTDYAKMGWQNVAMKENRRFQGKEFGGNSYIQATAHGGTAGKRFESWIVSPALNLDGAASKIAKVKLAQGYSKESTVFEVYVLQCVDNKIVQTKITPSQLPPFSATSYSVFVPATLDLSAFTGKVYVAFRYEGDGGQSLSTTWQIDDFSFNSDVVGETKVLISSGPATSVAVGGELNFNVSTTISNPVGATTITATGVPAWITFTDKGDGTATLTGAAPSAVETVQIALTATNNGISATQTLSVSVTESVASDNLVLNGSFDIFTSGFANWTVDLPAEITLSQNASGKEGVSAKIVSPTKTVKFYQQVNLEAGKTYTLSYWYKASVNRFRIWSGFASAAGVITGISFPVADAANDPLRTNNGYYPAATDWTLQTHEFTMPADRTIFQLEFRYYGAPSSEFGLDEVKIVKKN